MARTGTNYTRAALAISQPRDDLTEALRAHVWQYLKADARNEAIRRTRAREVEAGGRRIFTARLLNQHLWDIRDWRTGEVLAEGDGGLAGCGAARRRLVRDGAWFDGAGLWDGIEEPEIVTPDVPPALTAALELWICDWDTSDFAIAEFLGSPTWQVSELRLYAYLSRNRNLR